MRKYLLTFILAATTCFTGCGDDESTTPEDNGSGGNIEKGTGTLEVSNNETFTISGPVDVEIRKSDLNGRIFDLCQVTIRSDQSDDDRRVRFFFYQPEALNQTIPTNGDVTISSQFNNLDEPYVSVFVAGEDETYISFSTSTGNITVSNSSSTENTFDVSFEVGNLTSFDNEVIEIKGAFSL
ncbi:MAG: hypothetical protein AAFQ94_22565 [Bacteroidota bacterium]